MPSADRQLGREEQAISDEYEQGDTSLEEYNQQMDDLHRDYRAAAAEAAEAAYRDELEGW